jgi:parallel beta-helix repeat protein
MIIEWIGREMKEISLLAAITIFILLSTTVPSSKANNSRDTSTSSNWLFFDNFDDGSADGWTEFCEESGFWDVVSGEYFVTVEIVENGISVVDSLNLADCVIETRLRFSDSEVGYRAGIVFRYVDNENYYSFEIGNEYDEIDIIKYSSINPEYGEKRTFIQPSFGNSSIIIDANIDYTLRIEIVGSTFTAFLDDQQVLSWVEETYTIGKVGLRARRADVSFDDFQVSYILKTITVPDDYLTIQAAINAANDGDTIFVRNGTYYENVVVNKSLSLIGESRDTILDGQGDEDLLYVETKSVTIKSFTLRNCTIGIYLTETSNQTNISDNTITDCREGIFIVVSSKNNITHNCMQSNLYGIHTFPPSSGDRRSFGNLIECNRIADTSVAIAIGDSHNNTVIANILENSYYGIQVGTLSNNNLLLANKVTNSKTVGIMLVFSSGNNLVANTITNTSFDPGSTGVFLYESSNNTLTGNTIMANTWGIMVEESSSDNMVYHNNLINNNKQSGSFNWTGLENSWDNGCEGNYWSNYNGSDLTGDGIGDTPYIINGNNQDNYPLMNPYWNPGDINHDLKVNIFDVVKCGIAYGSTLSSPDWNPHCDIAEPYGIINIFDLVMIATSYGEEYAP